MPREPNEAIMSGMAAKASLLQHFSALKDPRQSWKVLYPLPEILLLLLCATLAGADDFVETEWWGRQNLDFLRRFLPFRRGIPSHDTLNDLVNALDPALFKASFVAWVEALRETEPDIVAIDGKTSRRSHARARGREPLHLVSAPPRPAGRVPCGDWIDGLLAIDGPVASDSSWARRRWPASRTRSPPSRCCWSGCNSPVRWSPSTPWAARRGSPRRSWPRKRATCWR
jgi:hypothetical protein